MTQTLNRPDVRKMDSALLVDLLEAGFTLDQIREMAEPGWELAISRLRLNRDEVVLFRRLYKAKCDEELPHSVFFTLLNDDPRVVTLYDYTGLLEQQPNNSFGIVIQSRLKSYRRGRAAGVSNDKMLELLAQKGFELNVYLAALQDGLAADLAQEFSTKMDDRTYRVFQTAREANISLDVINRVLKEEIPAIEAEVGELHAPFYTYVTLRTEEPKLSHADAIEAVQKVCTRYDGRRLYLAARKAGRSHAESLAIAQYKMFDTFLASSEAAFISNKGIQASELVEILKAPPEVLNVLSEIIAHYAQRQR